MLKGRSYAKLSTKLCQSRDVFLRKLIFCGYSITFVHHGMAQQFNHIEKYNIYDTTGPITRWCSAFYGAGVVSQEIGLIRRMNPSRKYIVLRDDQSMPIVDCDPHARLTPQVLAFLAQFAQGELSVVREIIDELVPKL